MQLDQMLVSMPIKKSARASTIGGTHCILFLHKNLRTGIYIYVASPEMRTNKVHGFSKGIST